MPPLWITYAWTDNTEGDFDYLVQRLTEHGVTAQFDRVALVPGQRLWEQIGQKISSDELSGWAYLLIPFLIRYDTLLLLLAVLTHCLRRRA
jgi:hypothetical protein